MVYGSDTRENPLLALDVYKMGHMEQYRPGVTKVFSYLTTRSNKFYDKTVFFGLQYYISNYLLTPLEPWMAEEFLAVREHILGFPASPELEQKVHELCELGYWPLEIRAVPEGTVIPVKNVLMTITNTLPEFYWCVGFIESLILKVWYTTTVATVSFRYREKLQDYYQRYASEAAIENLMRFAVHDFGYRGDSSEEGAALSGVAHLLSFTGSDCVPAFTCATREYYADPELEFIMGSVPASEHSVMCSYGQKDEIAGFRRMMELYPNSIVSIVSDTYSIWDVLTKHAVILKDDILARPPGAKVVFRPDSGDPLKILCGDPDAPNSSPEHYGVIQLLAQTFGYTRNEKGLKVLNPSVGVLYGDGMYFERWVSIMEVLINMGYSPENLIIGVGGILRHHTRDTFGFALKATYIEVNGVGEDIMKDPVTDHSKKSHKGIVGLFKDEEGNYVTRDQLTWQEFEDCELVRIVKDDMLLYNTTLGRMRDRVESYLAK